MIMFRHKPEFKVSVGVDECYYKLLGNDCIRDLAFRASRSSFCEVDYFISGANVFFMSEREDSAEGSARVFQEELTRLMRLRDDLERLGVIS